MLGVPRMQVAPRSNGRIDVQDAQYRFQNGAERFNIIGDDEHMAESEKGDDEHKAESDQDFVPDTYDERDEEEVADSAEDEDKD